MRRVSLYLGVGLTCLGLMASCEVDTGARLPANASDGFDLAGHTLLARIVHISDMHMVDEESPARFAGAQVITRSAWRPYEAYAAQLFDGIIRAANRIHADGRTVDFLVQTGDGCDNAQRNELAWMLAVFDGERVNPLSGPDDRPVDARPLTDLDPHAAFDPQGLFRQGVHGGSASIPWYGVFGNHDAYSIGVFPIFEDFLGHRVAPLPLDWRPDIVLPGDLDPVGFLTHGRVTPAMPGPPDLFELPQWVEPNADRSFFSKREYIRAMFGTTTGPLGHGFSNAETGPTWYSVSPTPGLRLIGLDTCDPAHKIPGFFYMDGSVSAVQLAFLRTELAAAQERSELVIVASHHPSADLQAVYGTAATGSVFRELLNEYPNVILHLAGHSHRNRVSDRDGYVEIETCSTLDMPQEGRLIEIYRDDATGDVAIAYEMFSHLDDGLPALGDDPLRGLRQHAQDLAVEDAGAAARQRERDPTGADPAGETKDRLSVHRIRRAD